MEHVSTCVLSQRKIENNESQAPSGTFKAQVETRLYMEVIKANDHSLIMKNNIILSKAWLKHLYKLESREVGLLGMPVESGAGYEKYESNIGIQFQECDQSQYWEHENVMLLKLII